MRELLPTAVRRPPASESSAGETAGAARLFLALWPDADEQAALVRYRTPWAFPPGSSPIRAERLHMTLHFIGQVDRRHLNEVSDGLAVPLEPFAIDFSRAEIWPRGLAVLPVTETPSELRQLHARLGDALRRLELPVEKRGFRPHVTLARRVAGTVPPSDDPQLRWQVSDYSLVESLRGSSGGYRIVRHYAPPPTAGGLSR